MKILVLNVSRLRSGVGNYLDLILRKSTFEYDVLNVSLFSNASPEDYPRSHTGTTQFISTSDNVLSGFLKFFLGYTKLQMLKKIDKMIATSFYDTTFLVAQDLIFLSRNIRMKTGKPVVATVHDAGLFRTPLHPFKFFLDANFKRINDLDLVFFDSNKTKVDVYNNFMINVPTTVVELTVDQNIFFASDSLKSRKHLHLPVDKKLILSVGADSYVKNISTLIRAFSLIDDNNIILVRVGKLKESQKVFTKLPGNVRERIVVRENVEDRDLPLYYSSADLFVFPSIAEGFGLELLEAAFCNLPVVTTRRDPMRDLLESNGHFVDDPFNAQELADVMMRALVSNNQEILKNYDNLRRRFSVDIFIKKYEEAIINTIEMHHVMGRE